jgi:putative ABC transport system permease protein
MSPHRLALRTLMLGRPRSVLAMLLIAASLCVLDLFAGNIASIRARLEYQAVIGERLGHLAVVRAQPPGADTSERGFSADEALKIQQIVEAGNGVALVVPQMGVSGIASTDTGSTLFHGEGVRPVPPTKAGAMPDLPGKLNPAVRTGVAVSSSQARSLGLRNGSSLTLTAVAAHVPTVPVHAEVVDIFSTSELNDGARSVLIPFELAQGMLDTTRVERVVIYLSDTYQLEARRVALQATLTRQGLLAEVRNWQEMSLSYARERSASELTFDSIAGMVFAVIAATIAATIAMNALERRREVATLRVLGMHSSGVFFMFLAEALWMALTAVAFSLAGSGLIAWVVNRISHTMPFTQGFKSAPMLVELDFNRMLTAVLTVLAVALLASLVPAFRAARADMAEGLIG